MKQVLHIFRKDTRTYWLEIAASVAVLLIFVCLAPSHWDFSEHAMRNQVLDVFLPMVLVPATWWLLIARAVHAESLVGDRQWWLTRPYTWKSLLTAKVLFILVWIYLPYVVAVTAILELGGFSPLAHLGGWFYLLAMVSGFVLLPLAAIAAITTNFAHMTLNLLGIAVIALAAVNVILSPRHGYESMVPYGHTLTVVAVLTAGLIIAVLLQYGTRRAWLARAVVVGAALLATGTGMLFIAQHESEINRDYPAANASASAPVQLGFAQEWELPKSTYSERPDKVYVELPVLFSGIAKDSAIQVNDVKVTMKDPLSGRQWATPWWISRNMHFLPGEHHGDVQIMLDRDQYERFRSARVTLHLTLAVTELHSSGEAVAAISTSTDLPATGFGFCSARWLYRFPSQLICRSPLGTPPLTYITTMWSKAQEPNAYVPPGPITGTWWSGTPYGNDEVYALFPVQLLLVNLYPVSIHGSLSSTHGLELAPGTPVHFTQYSVTRRTQVSLTIPNFQLPDEPR